MRSLLCCSLVLVLCGTVAAEEPCRSGPRSGQRPGPYSALVAVGAQRGTQHCYVCEAGDRPIVIVFARGLSEPLGKLVKQIDGAVVKHRVADLRAWVTFLAEDQTALDPKVVAWAKDHAVSNVPLGVFEDTVGPPAYLLARDADVTVLLAVRQRVVANFAFRRGALTDAATAEIMKALPRIVETK